MADDLLFGAGEAGPTFEIPLGGAPGSVVDTDLNMIQALRLLVAESAGERSGAGTATETFKNPDGTKTRFTADVDSSGNRTITIVDLT
jgi:hypothetical protein